MRAVVSRFTKKYGQYQNFEKFLRISVYLEKSINTVNKFSECYNDELINFVMNFVLIVLTLLKLKSGY